MEPRWILLSFYAALLVAAPVTRFALAQDGDEGLAEFDDDDVYEDDEPESPVTGNLLELDERSVVALTNDNFDNVIQDNEYVLVEFYAPWCGHCKSLAPEYAQAALRLKGYEPKVMLAKVDATVEKDLAEKYEVAGFPTLFFFAKGTKMEYTGGRKNEEIVAWIRKKTGPPALTLNTKDDINRLLETEKVAVIGFFDKFKGQEWEAFQAVARDEDLVPFGQTTNKAVAKIAQITGNAPAVVLLKEKEEKLVRFDGPITQGALSAFVKSNKLPLVTIYSEETSDAVFNNPSGRVVMLFTSADDLDQLELKLQEVSRQFKGQAAFALMDTGVQVTGPVIDFFGIDKTKQLQLVAYNQTGNTKHRYDKEFEPNGAKEFVAAFLANKAPAYYKSEARPATNDEPVKVVVGDTFEEMVLDKSKDVILEVYAPWCGHCKKLEPTWNKLGKRFRSIDSIMVAKMDGTANEHPLVTVQGFPSIVFFKAGDNSEAGVVVNVQNRTLKEFTEYLKVNAAIPFQLKKKEGKAGEKAGEEKTVEDGAPEKKRPNDEL